MALAWFARALQSGGVLAWAWCLVLGAVAVVQLLVVRDSRAPLLLADDQGVRVRHGETWSGLRWQDIDHVEVASPSSWLHDGRIVVHPRETRPTGSEETDAGLTPQMLTVPLAATTRLRYDGLTGDLVADLDALASGRTPVVVVTGLEPAPSEPESEAESETEPETSREADPETEAAPEPSALVSTQVEMVVLGGAADADGLVLPRQATPEERDGAETEPTDESADELVDAVEEVQPLRTRKPEPEPVEPPAVPFTPVDPVRQPRPAARSETVRDSVRAMTTPVPAQRGTGETPVVVAHVDDLEVQGLRPRPAAEPVIGPIVTAARHRARLSIDTLSERTRIRPHVLECIEVDDFEPCGGDFYARGHLRTLARVFGLDAARAARAVRRALRAPGDRGPSGLRGRAGDRHRRRDALDRAPVPAGACSRPRWWRSAWSGGSRTSSPPRPRRSSARLPTSTRQA